MSRRAALLSLLLASPSHAVADGPDPATEPAPIVLLAVSPGSPVAVRLQAELVALGLAPTPFEGADLPGLLGELRGTEAAAAVAIDRDERIARLWVVDAASGEVRDGEVRAGRDHDGEVLVLRVVEHLRARLSELRAPSPPPAAVPARRPPDPAPALADAGPPEPPPSPGPRLGLELGAAIGGSPGGPDPSLTVRAGAALRVDRWLELAVLLDVPVLASVVRGPEGEADVFVGALGLDARVPLLDPSEPLQPHLALGARAVLVASSGRAEAPRVATQSAVMGAWGLLGAGARWAFSEHVGLRLDFAVGLSPQRFVVAFASREVASFGQPWLSAGLGLDARL